MPRPHERIGNWVVTTRSGRVVIDLDPVVFGVSSVLIVGFVIVALAYRTSFAASVGELQAWVASRAG